MAYGSGTTYTVRVYQSSVVCGNQNFTDPIFGVEKACYVSVNTTTAALSTTGTTTTPTTTIPTTTGTNTNTTPTTSTTATGGSTTSVTPPTTTTTNGSISLRLATNRISGTAPLAVHFDASDTTTTIAGIQAFHDIRYEFNF